MDRTRIYVAPLINFAMPPGTVRLAPDLYIDHLSDAQMSGCDRWGISTRDATRPFAGIFLTRLVPQPSGDVPAVYINFDAYKQIRDVTCALRVFKGGAFGAPLIVEFDDTGDPGGGSFGEEPMPAPSMWQPRAYELTGDEAGRLPDFWAKHAPGFGVARLDYALRRFSLACARHSAEDALVDLMIAAESLFLRDASDELKYRLSIRFAFFISDTAKDRLETYRQARLAYDVRSGVVHGKSSHAPKAIRLNGAPEHVGLLVFVRSFEERMRAVMSKVMIEAPEGWPPDWETDLLSR